MKRLVIGIIAHVDAGKTTLSEALLYSAGMLRKQGRVDRGDCLLDNYDQERQRGITIFSKQAMLRSGDMEIALLDTPGHADFTSEMERTLRVLDYAILVISGTDGMQAHTDTLRTLLEKYKIPVFVFVTKMDVSALEKSALLDELRTDLFPNCVDFSPEALKSSEEELAVLDEELLEHYLDSGELTDGDIAGLIKKRRLYPVFFGSGLKLEGVDYFLDCLDRFTLQPKYPEAFGATVFKISRDSRGKRLTFVKITGGSLKARDVLRYLPQGADASGAAGNSASGDGVAVEEKVSELRLYSGPKYETVDRAEAGMVCALPDLSGTRVGMGFGIEPDADNSYIEPALTYTLVLPKNRKPGDILPGLRLMEEEDPQLHVVWNSEKSEIRLMLMGPVQIDVIKAMIKERLDTDVTFDSGRIIYRETISATVEGVGHYEPLKHYAEVHLILEPLPQGSGLVFDTVCPTDNLDLNWQRLVLTHLEEKVHRGVLTGSPITDMRITLAAGRAHLKHTEGGDFRQATYRAVRQGLMNALSRDKCVLLEPYYEFRLDVPSENIGRAISDIHSMGGEHLPPETTGGRSVLTGTAPVASMAGYMTDVMSYTGGRGRFSCHVAGFRPCREAEAAKVIAEADYDPVADIPNSPDSVFCAHGAGFNVRWDEVPDYMHLGSVLAEQLYDCDGLTDFAANGAGIAAGKVAGKNTAVGRNAAKAGNRSNVSIDEKELEAIMEREFGPIRRKSYSTATVNSAPVQKTKSLPRKERLIVDGYNLMFGWDTYRDLAAESMDLARERLIETMVNYSSFRGTETVLVFDGYKVHENTGEKTDRTGLHVVYTKENETADLYIERLADEIGKNENVRVVTSDSLIRLAALRAGVLRTSTKEFISEVTDTIEQLRSSISGH